MQSKCIHQTQASSEGVFVTPEDEGKAVGELTSAPVHPPFSKGWVLGYRHLIMPPVLS